MFTGIDQKLVTAIGAALAAATIVASGASAQVAMVEGGGGSEPATVGHRTPDGYDVARTEVASAIDKVEANRIAALSGRSSIGSDDVVSRYLGRNGSEGSLPQPTGNVVGSDDGFAWDTFGIATGSAFGLIALCGVALLALRRGRVAHA